MLSTHFRRENVLLDARWLLALLAVCLCYSGQIVAQTTPETQKLTPQIEGPAGPPDVGVGRTRMECAGYFRLPPLNGLPQIAGGEQEQERHVFVTGDIVYIDAGSEQGIKEGQEFHVIRPRGFIERSRRQKKGNLGVFVQEFGELRVVSVKHNVSVAQISFACDGILLGDLLTGLPDRTSPVISSDVSLDRFSDPTGKPTGRIMMAHDGREMIARGDLIYIDIGAEDKVVAGDSVTIYREVGTGNLGTIRNEELARRSDTGFASEQYRGGTFSMQAQRSKDVKDEPGQYRHSPIKTSQIRDKRPEMPRKIVGEAVLVNVQQRTATAIIVNSAQEIHTGDFVEIK